MNLSIIVPDSADGREVLRHSTAHVLAEAVTRLFPGAKYAIGPSIADGFYYDFDLPGGGDVQRRRPRADRSRDERDRQGGSALRARGALRRRSAPAVRRPAVQARDHREGASGGPADEDAGEAGGTRRGRSVYRNVANGDAVHRPLPRPARSVDQAARAFKLTQVAGAYWRGNEKGPMLQRIYGTAWESKEALAEHLHRLEEAEQRDHRKLGVELDLFSFPEEIGSGLAVFHPKGALVRRIMEEYSRQRHERRATSS